MDLERVLQFYKARTAGNGRSRDDPYAVVRFILNNEHTDWAGDRGYEPTDNPEAPPWGYGDYAKSPQGIGAVATEALMNTAVGILDEEGYTNKAFRRIHQLYTNAQSKKQEKFMELSKDVTLQKISPDLARFLASAAGWAMSDDTVRSGGGIPRGQGVSNAEWERALRQEEMREEQRRRRHERDEDRRHTAAERRKMRKSVEYPTFEKVNEFWGEFITKDHAPVPPRQGLVWDAVKHRWVRPENHGHTVAEVQGGKRFRAAGTGAHERSVGGHGSGPARLTEAGRRFRGVTDTGTLKPHERKHPATQRIKRTKSKGKGKMKRALGYTRTG